MRILYATDGFPYPLTSGHLRHYHLIRGLSERHEIDLLSMVGGDHRAEHRVGMEPYVSRIETFRSTGRRSVWLKASRRAADHLFGGGADRAARVLAGRASELVAEKPYDVVVVTGRQPYPVADGIGSTPLVVDLCDATSSRLAANFPYASVPRRAALLYQMGLARSNERRLIARSRHLLFASARDRDQVLDGADMPNATVVPNGVDLGFWHRGAERLGEEVVFSGVMHYPPNDDAARFLVGQVMREVWKTAPETRVRIIGRDPSRALRKAASDPRVTITGFVEDVRTHLERGAVYVAPLRFASGIQNKLLEAMAMEIPVITSPIAVAGLRDGTVEPPLVVAENDAPRLAQEVLAALARVRKDPRPDGAARRYVAERFRWDRAVRIFEDVLEGVRRAA